MLFAKNIDNNITCHLFRSFVDSACSRNNPIEDDLVLKVGNRGRNRGEFTNPQGVTMSPDGKYSNRILLQGREVFIEYYYRNRSTLKSLINVNLFNFLKNLPCMLLLKTCARINF